LEINERLILESISYDKLDDFNIKKVISSSKPNEVILNPEIIKDGRKQYYLIGNELYKVKKDKSQGILHGTYVDGKIIEKNLTKNKK
jgi:hypothetical protein